MRMQKIMKTRMQKIGHQHSRAGISFAPYDVKFHHLHSVISMNQKILVYDQQARFHFAFLVFIDPKGIALDISTDP
jgi:hypothetical protein